MIFTVLSVKRVDGKNAQNQEVCMKDKTLLILWSCKEKDDGNEKVLN